MKKTIGIVAATTTLALVASSATAVADDRHHDPEKNPTTVSAMNGGSSGKALYKALFFGTGKTAIEIEESISDPTYSDVVRNLNGESEVEQISEEVASKMESEESNFFSRFEEEVTSGDPYRVEDILAETSNITNDKMEESLKDEVENNPELREQLESGTNETPEVDTYLLWVAAAAAVVAVGAVWSVTVLINYAGAVNVGGAVNVAKYKYLAKSQEIVGNKDVNTSSFQERVSKITTELSK
ncbi:hypothetical protein [Corynebacterium neomassiliense]|uniref:hypothetical protein n=1 Tax=Corynebacterium neomassiliense TaxID=2079482 RepID=UPI00102F58E1|nr:hypothetical protein [Corynebacterium neomassiliense]